MIKGWDPHKQTGEDFVRIEIYNYFPPNAHGKGVFPAHTYAVLLFAQLSPSTSTSTGTSISQAEAEMTLNSYVCRRP